MSKLSDLHYRIQSLEDIQAVLNAMKNLSQVEITKISRYYATQRELFHTVEDALADFQRFYGAASPHTTHGSNPLYILIGSERGFCGAFNEEVQRRLQAEPIGRAAVKLIVIGRKLALKFADDQRVLIYLDGASTAEEIPNVISRLAKALARFPNSRWKIIHNSYTSAGAQVEVECPFEFLPGNAAARLEFAPLLNLPPSELRPHLFEQYLFALFYGIFYLSFMAENHDRLRHMDGALNKLNEQEQQLRQRANSLRQETITQELEVIMLSADNSQDRSGDSSRNKSS